MILSIFSRTYLQSLFCQFFKLICVFFFIIELAYFVFQSETSLYSFSSLFQGEKGYNFDGI